MTEMDDVTVKVEQGILRGCKVKDGYAGTYYSFQGIPYAKPPVGNLRFRAPQPPEKWSGIRDATMEGDACYARDLLLGTYQGSENCLILNVFTSKLPRNNKDKLNKAVMVWIHGGAFTHGSSKTMVYGPEFLIAEDVVLVSINYRLGVLGFLRLHDPELGVPGNAGLKDQVMALKWVQKNISIFGGDPNNVTLFGESAGAASVHYHILSPMSSGLFHKAIMQSGCALNPWALGSGNVTPLAQQLGIKTTNEKEILKYLQEVPVENLVRAQNKLNDALKVWRIRNYAPVVEGISKEPKFLPARPIDIIRSGRYNKVPMIIGYNNKEGLIAAVDTRGDVEVMTDFENAIPYELRLQRRSDISKTVAQRIKDFYYDGEIPSNENIDIYFTLIGDIFFTVGLHNAIRGHIATNNHPIYLYKMELESQLNIFKRMAGINHPGVCHADELGYLFKTVATPELKAGSDEELYVKRFTKMWTNFAKTGNPSILEEPERILWPAASAKALDHLSINKETVVRTDLDAKSMTLWQDIYQLNKQSKL